MCKTTSIFPNLQSSAVFEWLLKFISRKRLSQKWIITVLDKNVHILILLFKCSRKLSISSSEKFTTGS